MKKRIIAILLASVAVVHADTLTYTFDSGLGATGTSIATATNVFYTRGFNAEGNDIQETAQRAWYDQDASGDDVYWQSARLTDNKGTDDVDLNMTLGNPSYISFPLEVASSNQLDFTGATLDLTGILYKDTAVDFNMGYQIWAKPAAGTWELIGAKQVITSPAANDGTGSIYEVDETTRPIVNDNMTAGAVGTTVSNLTFDISSLGALGIGQSVEIAVAVSGTRDAQNNFNSAFDDVVISNFTVSVISGPPPYTGTLYLGDGVDSYTTSPATWDSTSANWGLISNPATTPWTNWISGSDVVIGVPAVDMETGASFIADSLIWNYDGALTLSGDGSTVLTVSNQIACTAPTARQLSLGAGPIGGSFSLLNVSRLSFNAYGVEADTHITTDAASDIQFETGAPADFSDLTLTLGGSSSIILDLGGVDRTVGSLSGIGGLQVASSQTLTITEISMGEDGSVGSLLANGSSEGNLQLGSGTHTFDLIPGTTSSDYISMGGSSLTFGGDLIVQATTTNKLSLGDKFQLFEAGTYTGAFNSEILPTNNLPAGAVFFNDLATDGSISVGTDGIKYSVIRFDEFNGTSTWAPGSTTAFGSITNSEGTIFTLTASAQNPAGDTLTINSPYLQGIDSTSSSNNVSYRFDSGNIGYTSDDEQIQFTLSVDGSVDGLEFNAIKTEFMSPENRVEVLDRNSTSVMLHSNVTTITESDLPGLEVLTKDNVDDWSIDLIARERLRGVQGQWSLDYVEFTARYNIGSAYDAWASLWGEDIGDETNDVEPDGMDNLTEYALGGKPTVDDADTILPEFVVAEDGGTDWFYYIHNERTDDASLTFTVQLKDDLIIDPTWKTTGVEFVGESAVVDDFKSVTNRTDVASNKEFLRLLIEQD